MRITMLALVVASCGAIGTAQQVVLSTDDFDRSGPNCLVPPFYVGGCNWATAWAPFVGPNMNICPVASLAAPASANG